jgi:protein phosphatase
MSDPELQYGLALAGAAATHVGVRRKVNQDRVLMRLDLDLFVVADGAGGHNAGEVASGIAVEIIESHFAETQSTFRSQPPFDKLGIPTAARRLSLAVHQANEAVARASHASSQHRGMGSTVVAACFSAEPALLHVAHVGDSRCYRLRGGHLEALTQDHSVATDVLEQRPDIDDRVLLKLPKNAVTRALGMTGDVRVAVRSHGVVAGDRYLLCSDGLSGAVGSADLAAALAANEPPETIVDDLIARANAAGGPDNIAAIVIDCPAGPDLALPASSRPEALRAGRFHGEADTDPELLILGIEDFDLGDPTGNEGLMGAIGELLKGQKPKDPG